MGQSTEKPVLEYAVAALAVAAVALLRLWLDPWLDDRQTLIMFCGAVALAVWHGGWGPALVAAVLGFLTADYLFIPPRHVLGVAEPREIINALVYLASCGVIIAFGNALRSANRRVRTVLRSITDCLFVLDHGWRFVYLNPQAVRYFGRPREEMLGRVIWDLFPQIVGSEFEHQYRHALDRGEPVHFEARSLVTGLWVEVRAYPSREGLSVFFDDVTARHDAEELVRAKESQLRHITDAAPALISYVDADGRYRLNNRGYEKWFGRRREEMTGRHLREVLGEAAWQAVCPHVEAALAGREVSYEQELPYRDGGTRWVRASYTPHRDEHGRVLGFVALVYDITEARRAEQALRESEQRFARFMQHLPGLAWIKDVEGRYVFVNDAAAKTFGTPRPELYGKTDADLFPPEVAAQFGANDRRAVASEGGVQVIETLEHDDGVLHHSIVSKFPIPGPDGTPALVGGMAIDVTDRLRAEAALQEADRRKDEFLATLAHELRNPLAPIRNALHILKIAGDNAAALAEARATMERQLGQMVRLIDDLLDISRITRGKVELRKERVELAAVLNSAVETSRPLFEATGHQLTVELPAEPIYLDADPTRLAQVFSNLLNNAAKFTDRGGRVWLTALLEDDKETRRQGGKETGRQGDKEGGKTDEAPSFVSLSPCLPVSLSHVTIRVRDTGIGIPAEALPRVFDMFTQVDRSLERAQGGLGIGLTLVRSLAELHGGSAEAHSDGPGKGSTFTVRLPVAPHRAAEPAPPSDGKAPRRGLLPRRVLIVDDNRDAADSLAILLRMRGAVVRTAYDGMQAVEAATSFRPEVVLLDIGLPRLNGYDAARQIRLLPGGPEMMLIALTGWGQDDDRRRSQEAGFDRHLVKPVDPNELEAVLTERAARPVGGPQRPGPHIATPATPAAGTHSTAEE